MQKPALIACLGDSITAGNVSYNWVKSLSNHYKDKNIQFKNFGINGNLAYNALQRLKPVVDCKPDIIFVLLGTNDINASMTPSKTKHYTRSNKLPQTPTKQWYIANMEAILTTLQQQTQARIALISIPILGEDLSHLANQKVDEYNKALQETAQKFGVDYLDLNKEMRQALDPKKPGMPLPDGFGLIAKAILRHFILFQNWDKISQTYGLQLTTDTIHLNSISGQMLENLTKNFIDKY